MDERFMVLLQKVYLILLFLIHNGNFWPLCFLFHSKHKRHATCDKVLSEEVKF